MIYCFVHVHMWGSAINHDSKPFQMCTQKGQATDHICRQFVYLDKTSTLAIVVAQ